MQSFKDKVVVVTGGNSGIGKTIAESFHAAGAKLALFGRDQQKLNAVAEELKDRVMTIQGDVCQLSDIDKLYKEVNKTYGKIDALIVNAGIAGNMKVDEVDEQHFDSIMNTNLKGAYFTVQKAVPYLNQNASIILISSMACHGGWPGLSVYSAAKAAVSTLAQSFSADLIDRGIRVNAISPGFTDTPIFEDRSAIPKIANLVPLKRFAEPQEIADAALFLAKSTYITGTDLLIDGGITSIRPQFRD